METEDVIREYCSTNITSYGPTKLFSFIVQSQIIKR